MSKLLSKNHSHQWHSILKSFWKSSSGHWYDILFSAESWNKFVLNFWKLQLQEKFSCLEKLGFTISEHVSDDKNKTKLDFYRAICSIFFRIIFNSHCFLKSYWFSTNRKPIAFQDTSTLCETFCKKPKWIMQVPTIFILYRQFKVAGIDNYIILLIIKLPKAL